MGKSQKILGIKVVAGRLEEHLGMRPPGNCIIAARGLQIFSLDSKTLSEEEMAASQLHYLARWPHTVAQGRMAWFGFAEYLFSFPLIGKYRIDQQSVQDA